MIGILDKSLKDENKTILILDPIEHFLEHGIDYKNIFTDTNCD